MILPNYSGHGLMGLTGYDIYLSGKLTDYELPDGDMKKLTKQLENVPKAEVRTTGKWQVLGVGTGNERRACLEHRPIKNTI